MALLIVPCQQRSCRFVQWTVLSNHSIHAVKWPDRLSMASESVQCNCYCAMRTSGNRAVAQTDPRRPNCASNSYPESAINGKNELIPPTTNRECRLILLGIAYTSMVTHHLYRWSKEKEHMHIFCLVWLVQLPTSYRCISGKGRKPSARKGCQHKDEI